MSKGRSRNNLHLLSLIAILTTLFSFNIANISAASAAPGSADLSVSTPNAEFLGQVWFFSICNMGDETVTDIDLDINTNNWTPDTILPINSGPTDLGSFSDLDSWSGELRNGECLQLASLGMISDDIGEDVTGSISIASSTLEGSIPNIDPESSNDTGTVTPYEVVELPDLTLSTRLLTSGVISSGTNVSYEVTIENIGQGDQPTTTVDNYITIAFVIPPSASFNVPVGDPITDIVDLDANDDLNIQSCMNYGSTSNLNAATGTANPGNVGYCQLELSSPMVSGTTAKFQFNMVATSDFASGNEKVTGLVLGVDRDAILFQTDMVTNTNVFARETNNKVILTYNTAELQTTINRCPGQGATTTNGTGCFRVSFNKLIYAPDFIEDDLVLTGGGTVTGFTRLDDYTWEVNVSGIPAGATVALTLAENSVQDYSAVMNGVQVLGENTIRYEAAGSDSNQTGNQTTTANGTLANTGAGSGWQSGLVLILIGAFLLITQRFHRKLDINSNLK